MAVTTYSYEPDYAVPPGWVVEEHLQSQRLSHAEFARRCGRSAKLISEIIAGKAPIEPRTALQFEKVLGLDASIWLGIEARYQLHKAREVEAQETKRGASWIKAFPVKELVHRGVFDKPASDAEARSKLLAFFGVGSVNAWHAKYEDMSVAYRHSPSFQSDKPVLVTWLRLGELEAEQQDCADYNEARFKRALKEIRSLTQTPVVRALEKARPLCNEAGVAWVLVKPLPKTALSGAAWWLTPRKAVIELSIRHKTDDHLWFSLFHEAAHLLLHSKKDVFIDWMNPNEETADVESEANQWASNFLISRGDWKLFVTTSSNSEIAVRQFAEDQGIAPSIIIGRLQHENRLSWQTPLNKLKIRLEWKTTP